MNKKKQTKATRGREYGGVVTRTRNIPRIITRSSRPLQERDVQENKRNVFRDKTSASPIKKAPPRRGRPRTRTVELPSCARMIMYVPVNLEHSRFPHRQTEACQVAPVLPMPRCQEVQPVHFRAQTMSIVMSPKKSMEGETCALKDKWPRDLEQLVIEWDHLPQGHLWEVIKWLSSPMLPSESSVPLMVANLREMMAEWEEEYDVKIHQILKWLGYDSSDTHPVTPPKVVVEMESASIQPLQWSSMIELKESRQP